MSNYDCFSILMNYHESKTPNTLPIFILPMTFWSQPEVRHSLKSHETVLTLIDWWLINKLDPTVRVTAHSMMTDIQTNKPILD